MRTFILNQLKCLFQQKPLLNVIAGSIHPSYPRRATAKQVLSNLNLNKVLVVKNIQAVLDVHKKMSHHFS